MTCPITCLHRVSRLAAASVALPRQKARPAGITVHQQQGQQGGAAVAAGAVQPRRERP